MSGFIGRKGNLKQNLYIMHEFFVSLSYMAKSYVDLVIVITGRLLQRFSIVLTVIRIF